MERTFTIIKPDATAAGNTGNILAILQSKAFKILAMRQTRMSRATARAFYAEHEGKGFYDELVEYMTSGPVVVAVLEKENAIKDLRNVMGATNPEEAAEGTIRKLYGENIGRNAIHGSANADDAHREVYFFFGEADFIV